MAGFRVTKDKNMGVFEQVSLILGWIWDFFSTWWWLIAPPALLFLLNDLWLIAKTNEYTFYKMEWMILEVRPPQIVDRTPQAMEQVFAGLHGIFSGPKWFERYRDGKISPWISCEIVSLGGDVRFYIRCLKKHRNIVEANIWAQYPDAEIRETDDYVNSVPRDIPNEQWNMWGCELQLMKPDPYPIKTYEDFEDPVEERRLDPLASMLEIMSSIQPGEQLWFQMLAQPVFGGWKDSAKAEIDKLMGRKPPRKKGLMELPFIGELLEFLMDFGVELFGVFSPIGTGERTSSESDKKTDREPTFMMLSPGTQDQIKAIERNVGKLGYKTNMRFVYVGRNETFNKGRVSEFFGSLRQFNSENLNSIGPNKETTPDVEMRPFSSQRNYRRKRLLDRHYRFRLFKKKSYVLNTEELATIFHFPGMQVAKAPAVGRIDAKRGEPPATLPAA